MPLTRLGRNILNWILNWSSANWRGDLVTLESRLHVFSGVCFGGVAVPRSTMLSLHIIRPHLAAVESFRDRYVGTQRLSLMPLLILHISAQLPASNKEMKKKKKKRNFCSSLLLTSKLLRLRILWVWRTVDRPLGAAVFSGSWWAVASVGWLREDLFSRSNVLWSHSVELKNTLSAVEVILALAMDIPDSGCALDCWQTHAHGANSARF